MPNVQLSALNRETRGALAVDGPDAGGLAASWWSMPGFFAGWIVLGVVLALVLVRRGHDARTMVALGAGLGPLMALVVSDSIRRRDREAQALVIQSGVDHGGPLDVLVLAHDSGSAVEDLATTIESVRDELGLLTVGRTVAYEWVEGDLDNEVVRSGESELRDAAIRLAAVDAELVLLPGRIDRAVERFEDRGRRTLVLLAGPMASTTGRRTL